MKYENPGPPDQVRVFIDDEFPGVGEVAITAVWNNPPESWIAPWEEVEPVSETLLLGTDPDSEDWHEAFKYLWMED